MAGGTPPAACFPCLDDALAFARLENVVPFRDVIVSSEPAGADFAAEPGDFWFHSDGCFLERPPRWVAIVIVEAEGGGPLSVLDREAVLDAWPAAGPPPSAPARFGAAGRFVTAPVWQEEQGVFRFRRDYMDDPPGRPGISAAAAEAVSRASSRALDVETARAGEVLLLDNWRGLHRRGTFEGRRVIRRLWYA